MVSGSLVHRAVYEQTRGEIPDGKQINHLCDRPYCFQPSHLYAGTAQDNADDARLFRTSDFISEWEVAHFDQHHEARPLRKRLRETNRYDSPVTWDPIEHPPQSTWVGFTCESHDFAIPMSGGQTKFCRICEESDLSTSIGAEHECPSLIKNLWPISQTVPEICEAIWKSEFTGQELSQLRRDAYRRSLGFDSHEIRDCECSACVFARRTFEEAAESRLTDVMLRAIKFAEAMRVHIRATVTAANLWAMGHLGAEANFDDEQVSELCRHIEQCGLSEAQRTANLIEETLGAASFYRCIGSQDAHNSPWASRVATWSAFGQRHPFETDEYLDSVLSASEELVPSLLTRWKSQLQPLPGISSIILKSGINPTIMRITDIGAHILVFEHIRYQCTGSNSHQQSFPHPHGDCIRQICETGHWEPFPKHSPFREGQGYDSDHDILRSSNLGSPC